MQTAVLVEERSLLFGEPLLALGDERLARRNLGKLRLRVPGRGARLGRRRDRGGRPGGRRFLDGGDIAQLFNRLVREVDIDDPPLFAVPVPVFFTVRV